MIRPLLLLCAVEAMGAPSPRLPWASTLPALLKVRPGRIPAGGRGRELSAAQGSCEAFQVVADPPAQSVRAVPESLRGPGRPLRRRIYREEWLDIRVGTNGQKLTRSGFEISTDPEVWERVRLEMISRLKLLSEKRPKR